MAGKKQTARKVRCLKTGRMYCTIGYKNSAAIRSENSLRNFNPEAMLLNTQKSCGRAMGRKRSKAAKKYFKEHPGEFSRRIKQAYQNNPELIETRRKFMQDEGSHLDFSDKEMYKRRDTISKEGVQVVLVDTPRERPTGVRVSD